MLDPTPRPSPRLAPPTPRGGNPVRRQRLMSFLEQDDDADTAEPCLPGKVRHGQQEGGAGRFGGRAHRWHLHRVQLLECTEHFVHDYAQSIRRRGVSRARVRDFHQVRLRMARAFGTYCGSLQGAPLMELVHLMIDHAGALEAAAGTRFPAKGA
jgi:hypothetical protein